MVPGRYDSLPAGKHWAGTVGTACCKHTDRQTVIGSSARDWLSRGGLGLCVGATMLDIVRICATTGMARPPAPASGRLVGLGYQLKMISSTATGTATEDQLRGPPAMVDIGG